MFEKLAWNNFLKTGSVETYMEYRKLNGISEEDCNIGDRYSEFDKTKGNSDKRNNI